MATIVDLAKSTTVPLKLSLQHSSNMVSALNAGGGLIAAQGALLAWFKMVGQLPTVSQSPESPVTDDQHNTPQHDSVPQNHMQCTSQVFCPDVQTMLVHSAAQHITAVPMQACVLPDVRQVEDYVAKPILAAARNY